MSRLDRTAKRMAPPLARILPQRALRAAGVYIDVLQGRGAGTGWDIASEAAAAKAALQGVDRPVIFDGGGNYGQWARSVYELTAHAQPQFFIFEPQSACQEALAALPFDKQIFKTALGDETGEITIAGAEPGFGAASIYERKDTYFGDMTAHQEVVPLARLDDIIEAQRLGRVDLLKLDVEGAELLALKGAERSMSDGVIRAVAFEFGAANIYSRTMFRDFWDLLEPLGFQLNRIAPGGRLVPIRKYSEELEHFRGVSNYLGRRTLSR